MRVVLFACLATLPAAPAVHNIQLCAVGQTWVEEDDLGRTKIIPIGAGVGKDADTTRRCIYHTEHQDSAEYKSTSADLHDPSKYQYVHTGRPALGPRAAMMQRKLAQEASYVHACMLASRACEAVC